MSHKEIARLTADEFGVGPWWSQMVTVGYEQARGLREKHETPAGYQISASKTIAVPIATLYRAWSSAARRRRWLPDAQLEVRKANKDKSMRITWVADGTSVDVNFWDKGATRSQVQLEHRKLPDAAACERMKRYWRAAVDRLKQFLEGTASE